MSTDDKPAPEIKRYDEAPRVPLVDSNWLRSSRVPLTGQVLPSRPPIDSPEEN